MLEIQPGIRRNEEIFLSTPMAEGGYPMIAGPVARQNRIVYCPIVHDYRFQVPAAKNHVGLVRNSVANLRI
jgi:hypothetical protein